MRVVLKRTVTGDSDQRFDNLSGSHHLSQVKSCLIRGNWLVNIAVMLLAVRLNKRSSVVIGQTIFNNPLWKVGLLTDSSQQMSTTTSTLQTTYLPHYH